MIPSAISYENLYRAYLDCRQNKRSKPDALRFEINSEENLRNLFEELLERTYHPSSCDCFVSTKPKLREIFASDFKDRIVHHLIVRYLEKIWEPVFIYDSYASRKAKGIHLAAKRLQGFTRKVTNNNTVPAYYMHLDIRSFFMNINKDILFGLIASRCRNPKIIRLAGVVIYQDPTQNFNLKSPESLLSCIPPHKSLFHMPKNKGLPIGNLTSQFFANVYLNGLDQFVKHELKCRFYMRYVDDFVLLDKNRASLVAWKEQIADYLKEKLQLDLNPSRCKIGPVSNGIDFLGYIVRPGYLLCRNRVVNNLKAKLRVFEQKLVTEEGAIRTIRYDDGILSDLFACVNSYFAHFKHASTYNLISNIFENYPILKQFYEYSKEKLKRIYLPPRNFGRIRTQYLYFLRRFFHSMIFFQVGCFYEFYGAQASKAAAYLKLKMIQGRYGFRRRCGIGKRALNRYVNLALEAEQPVVVINQTGHFISRVAERRIAVRYVFK